MFPTGNASGRRQAAENLVRRTPSPWAAADASGATAASAPGPPRHLRSSPVLARHGHPLPEIRSRDPGGGVRHCPLVSGAVRICPANFGAARPPKWCPPADLLTRQSPPMARPPPRAARIVGPRRSGPSRHAPHVLLTSARGVAVPPPNGRPATDARPPPRPSRCSASPRRGASAPLHAAGCLRAATGHLLRAAATPLLPGAGCCTRCRTAPLLLREAAAPPQGPRSACCTPAAARAAVPTAAVRGALHRCMLHPAPTGRCRCIRSCYSAYGCRRRWCC